MALTKAPVNKENVALKKSLPSHQLTTDFQLLEMFSEPVVESLMSEKLCSRSRTPNSELDDDNLDVGKDELFEINRLLQALGDFGLKPSTSQLIALRNRLSVNCNKRVRFGDFVEAVKDIFHEELIDKSTISGNDGADFKICIHNLSRKNHSLELENFDLRNEISILKKQLKSMENACSHTEDDLLATRKELQNCIKCIRKLKGEHKIETGHALSGDADCEHGIKSCVRQEPIKTKESNLDMGKENARLKDELKRMHASSSVSKAISYKLIYYLEDLQSNLMELIHTPRNKVGRSFSLYRNIAGSSGVQCSTTVNGAVSRAASVCTPMKGGNLQRQTRQIQHDTLVEITRKMKEVLVVSKEMLKSECHRKKVKEIKHHSFDPLYFSGGSLYRNPLHDLPPKTTITIMSRV